MTVTPTALVIGEALIDAVERPSGREEYPGGGPMNIAVGLARLGVPTTLHTQIGRDARGDAVVAHIDRSGVALTPGSRADGATSLAEATLRADGSASYRFTIAWDPASVDVSNYALVHTGSIGANMLPGADTVERALRDATGLVSYDPNIRADLMGDHAEAVARVERFVALSHIVKASDEDIAWLYPGRSIDDALAAWRALGPRLVVITRGGEGASALGDDGRHDVTAEKVTVIDTIGAGDSFMSALIAGALERGLDETPPLIAQAARAAAITVSRAGANPPRRAELVAP